MTKRDLFYSVCEIGERADRLSQDIGAHLPAADSELHGTLHRIGLVAFELARSIENVITGLSESRRGQLTMGGKSKTMALFANQLNSVKT